MLRSLRYIGRLLAISRVLAKHDALFFLRVLPYGRWLSCLCRPIPMPWHKKKTRGERLSRALQELGPTFIKLGQALSTRPDLIGEELAVALAELQDRLPPFPTKQAKAIIEEELRQPLDTVFSAFSEEAVAAASISQVHRAVDREGNAVAVKILRPKVARAFERDIALFRWIAATLTKRSKSLTRLKLIQVVEHFAETVRFELDLRFEAAAASELADNLKDDPQCHIPAIDWDRTSRRVLTMEWIDGIRIDDVIGLQTAGHDTERILQDAAELFFKQIYRDGFFHADMHPGNLLVDTDGRIAMVDFGIMGRLDHQTRLYLAEMLVGFLKRDYQKVSDIHFDAGYVPADQDRKQFAQACRSIGEPVFGKPQGDISIALLLAQLFKVTEDFQMETQLQLILLQKTMVYVEGIARTLNPKANFWELARPFIEAWGKKHLGPEARLLHLSSRVKHKAEKLSKAIDALEYLPQIITPQGLRLHPDTLPSRHSTFKDWKILALSAIVSALTVILLELIIL